MSKTELSFAATAIGSLPYTAPEQALDLIFASIPGCPIWPQLPKRGMREQMEIQYSEGLPCVVLDEAKGRMFFDTADEDAAAVSMGSFYEAYMMAEESDDWSAFAITEPFSAGIPAFEQRLKTSPVPLLKVQTTGPLSIGLSIVDENKRSIYYNEAFRDVIVKGMIAKCRWQIKKFAPYAQKVICFVDEPILSAFGSSTYVSVIRDDVVAILAEMVEAIHAAGALCGVHCCGNTEWPILIDAGVDIINFDAYEFGDTIALYPDQVKRHLEGGSYLAWGIVPTSDKIFDNTAAKLIEIYDRHVDKLAGLGIDKQLIHDTTIITPSCGTGSLPPETAEKVFSLLSETAAVLKARG
jgi:hypothetical protein